jgi:hypothetical protein
LKEKAKNTALPVQKFYNLIAAANQYRDAGDIDTAWL